jgi:hypothetical protein
MKDATNPPHRSTALRTADILESKILRSFKGPSGDCFFDHLDGEQHLAFGLFVDWFNPYGNKVSGKSYSVGAIFMVCLNLPIHLRYRVENVYLAGIIPGDVHLHQINNFLRLLVDDLVQLWNPGVYYTKTAQFAQGCLVRCALIPLIADVPAVRKTAGWTSHSANKFCSFCKQLKEDMANFDVRSWARRTWAEHMAAAVQWRDAPTLEDRNALFEMHSIRWSELLRLPYWDPTRFAVVDAMHNLFLGIFADHCRVIWEMDDTSKSMEGHSAHSAQQQAEPLTKCLKLYAAV